MDEKLLIEFLESEGLTDKLQSFLNKRSEKHIIWREGKTNINNEWWTKEGSVDGEVRFKLFCDKTIKIFLIDLKTNSKFEIKEGTHVAGYQKASKLIRPIKVEYLEPRRGKYGKRFYVPVYAIWNGEKAVFENGLDQGTVQIVVRNLKYLKKC